jgi:hypothetical protein
MQAIERLLEKPIEREIVDGFEPSFTLPATTALNGRVTRSRTGRPTSDAAPQPRTGARDQQPARRAATGGYRTGRTAQAGGPSGSQRRQPQARPMPGERLSGRLVIPGHLPG